MGAARVYVLYTGGTFGMAPDLATPGHPLRPLELFDLKAALAGEGLEGVEVTVERFERLIDSASMAPRDWVQIAERIAAKHGNFDGFVVIHGTDTLAYTASALAFLLENLGKPVVVTGSQLPLFAARTDAKRNYRHSLEIAGYQATGLPAIPEVIVVFGDRVLRGCRARKMSASAGNGFESPNCAQLGEIGERVRIFENEIRPAPPAGAELRVNSALDVDVLDITLTPALRAEHLRRMLGFDGVKGIVLRTYGNGNASEDRDFMAALREGIRDKVVVNITQCPQGMVEMGLYAASVGLIDVGVISGFDMTPEAALTKLMVTMGTRIIGEQVKLQMQINQRGEQSRNLFDFNYTTPPGPVVKTWSDFVVPDRRFAPTALSTAVLRMKNVAVTVAEDAKSPCVDVYMNYPAADSQTMERVSDPRRLLRIPLQKTDAFDVVETLRTETVKTFVGENEVTLTFVAAPGVTFMFDKLSLAMFTRA